MSAVYSSFSAFTQNSSPDLPWPVVLVIRHVTSFKMSFSEWMYANGLYLMDFLKLMVLSTRISYPARSSKRPVSNTN